MRVVPAFDELEDGGLGRVGSKKAAGAGGAPFHAVHFWRL